MGKGEAGLGTAKQRGWSDTLTGTQMSGQSKLSWDTQKQLKVMHGDRGQGQRQPSAKGHSPSLLVTQLLDHLSQDEQAPVDIAAFLEPHTCGSRGHRRQWNHRELLSVQLSLRARPELGVHTAGNRAIDLAGRGDPTRQ